MATDTEVIIDEGILNRYRALQEQGRPDVITEFIDVFLDDLPCRIARLRDAVGRQAPAAIRSAANALKGSAGSVGAVNLSGLCAHLEACARTGSPIGAPELLATIEPEALRASQELSRLRQP